MTSNMQEQLDRMEHTPEPWKSLPWPSNGVSAIGILGSGYCVAMMGLGPDHKTRQANAHRIVACVNACAGMDTAYLEVVRIKEILDAFQHLQESLTI